MSIAASYNLPKLIYVYDPLCGWCYGFSPVIKRIEEHFRDQMTFEVISGGMILHERVGPLSVVAPYIKEAYKRVEQTTGVSFGEIFLKDLLGAGDMMMNSWPGSMAMSIFKSTFPHMAISFASDIQKAIYLDGKSPEDVKHFTWLASQYGWKSDLFEQLFDDEDLKYATKQDFQMAQDLQASGYPTVLIYTKEQYFMVARGFTDFPTLLDRINQVLRTD